MGKACFHAVPHNGGGSFIRRSNSYLTAPESFHCQRTVEDLNQYHTFLLYYTIFFAQDWIFLTLVQIISFILSWLAIGIDPDPGQWVIDNHHPHVIFFTIVSDPIHFLIGDLILAAS